MFSIFIPLISKTDERKILSLPPFFLHLLPLPPASLPPYAAANLPSFPIFFLCDYTFTLYFVTLK